MPVTHVAETAVETGGQGPGSSDERTVELDCVIQPSQLIEVSGGVLTGILESIYVDRGDLVEEGQLLAVLDSRLEQATLDLARARVELVAALEASRATRDYYAQRLERATRLFNAGILSAELMEQAQEESLLAESRWRVEQEAHTLAQLELQRAQVAVDMRRLVSPVDGIVTEQLVDPGEFVGQAAILRIAKLDPLYVEIVVPASLYGSIRVGTTAVVMPAEPVGGRYSAEVTVVDTVLDAASNTFGVRLELPNPNYELPAGLRGRALVTVQAAAQPTRPTAPTPGSGQ